MSNQLTDKRQRLLAQIAEYGSCAVAFSGGVDSAVVAKAAQLALGDRALAVTADSPSLAEGELDAAKRLAELIGIRHKVVSTNEIRDSRYTANNADRCYYCKSELYSQLDDLVEELAVDTVANGANADDIGDYRPGMRAASERSVRSPLADCGFGKSEVRALAQYWELPVWDKPAMPCLASRVAYGEEVTPERMHMVDQAEQYLRAQGLSEVRVRYHRDGLARIEVAPREIELLASDQHRQAIVDYLTSVGFKFVTIDLKGFRSGSLNSVIPLSVLEQGRQNHPGAE